MTGLTAGLFLVIVGQATFYGPGVMDTVVANRAAWGQAVTCSDCLGYVALADAAYIGHKVWLRRPGYQVEGPFMVADCARVQDRPNLERSGWAVDVDYGIAQRWGMRGPLPGVEVYVASAGKITHRVGTPYVVAPGVIAR